MTTVDDSDTSFTSCKFEAHHGDQNPHFNNYEPSSDFGCGNTIDLSNYSNSYLNHCFNNCSGFVILANDYVDLFVVNLRSKVDLRWSCHFDTKSFANCLSLD